jgi:hypothetical protein
MIRSTQVTDLLNDLIIADVGDNGSSLPPGVRPGLENMLTRALLDSDRLNDHIRILQKQLGTRFRYRGLLDEATNEKVLHGGLGVLDDAALARLALNPIALAALADEIEERQPAGWAEALRQDGLELLGAHGRNIRPLDDLLGRRQVASRLGPDCAVLPTLKEPAKAVAGRSVVPWHFHRMAELDEIPILWGAWSAIDQYRLDRNPSRPNVIRPTDRELLEAAANGTLDGELFERFCKEYEVFRYPINVSGGRRQRLQAIADILAARYRNTEATTPNELAEVWWCAVEEVREFLNKELNKPHRMRSLCMKMLWFYRPEHATMWDSFAVNGINAWRGLKLNAAIQTVGEAVQFLEAFDALYREKEGEINRALETIAQLPGGMAYPCGRRALDKALWFRGAERSEQEARLRALVADRERDAWLRQRLAPLLHELFR